jgi:hypothetical protein
LCIVFAAVGVAVVGIGTKHSSADDRTNRKGGIAITYHCHAVAWKEETAWYYN